MDGLLDLYISQDPVPEGRGSRWSTLSLCIRDARRVSGRSVDRGKMLFPELATSWSGALAYLCVLDQIGHALQRTRLTSAQTTRCQTGNRQEKPFRAALVQCTTLGDRKISALYALRCSYAHFYGLVNVNSKPELQHRFVLIAEHAELVRFPPRPWDGTYPAFGGRRSKSGPVGTRIDLWTLGDVVEEAVANLRTRHLSGEIKRGQLGGGGFSDAEFKDRFTIGIGI